MTRRALISGAVCSGLMAGLCALALWLVACHPAEPDVRIYGSSGLTPATLRDIADHLDRAPADPWPCITSISIGARCPGTHGCYYPDEGNIYSSPEALGHEILHSAMECAHGNPDYDHTDPAWQEVGR